MKNQSQNNFVKFTCLMTILLLSMLSMGFKFPFWTPMVKAKAKPGDFEITIKMLSGKNLPEFVKGAEASSELEKYLLIIIVNRSGKMAWFDLEITGKNNPNVSLDFTVDRLPPSNVRKIPISYLYYIGSPIASDEPEETDFKYEIKGLYFG